MNLLECVKNRTTVFTFSIGLLLILGLSAGAYAATEYKIVNTDRLVEMFSQNKAFVLIDARSSQEYKEAHIKGSVSIPDKELKKNMSLLPKDRSTLIVIYCNGVKCGKSGRLAGRLGPLGYSNIMIYSEGIPVWEERKLPIVAGPEYGRKIETRKLSPAEIKKMVDGQAKDFVLVDVRDSSEFREGHIPTAINIPAEQFASGSGILPKEKKIIVYCNTGGRSYLAYRKLIQLAYPNIYQAKLADWKEAGMRLEK